MTKYKTDAEKLKFFREAKKGRAVGSYLEGGTFKIDDDKKTHDKNRKIYLKKLNKFRKNHEVISLPSDNYHALIVKRAKPLEYKALTGVASSMLKQLPGKKN